MQIEGKKEIKFFVHYFFLLDENGNDCENFERGRGKVFIVLILTNFIRFNEKERG
jgi:hypothetical protein